MKNVSYTIITVLFLSTILIGLSSCAFLGEESCVGECETSETDSSRDDDGRIDMSRLSVYTVDDEFIGWADGYHLDYVKMYIPSYDQHVTIHPKTGEYMKYPRSSTEEIYFSGENCTGDAVIIGWSGGVGNTYLVSRDNRTFVIQSTTFYNINNRFEANSKLTSNRPDTEPCSPSNTTIENYSANLVEVDALIDLTPYAPFQMYSPEND